MGYGLRGLREQSKVQLLETLLCTVGRGMGTRDRSCPRAMRTSLTLQLALISRSLSILLRLPGLQSHVADGPEPL